MSHKAQSLDSKFSAHFWNRWASNLRVTGNTTNSEMVKTPLSSENSKTDPSFGALILKSSWFLLERYFEISAAGPPGALVRLLPVPSSAQMANGRAPNSGYDFPPPNCKSGTIEAEPLNRNDGFLGSKAVHFPGCSFPFFFFRMSQMQM